MDQKTNIAALTKDLEAARSLIAKYAREARIEAALEQVRLSSLAMRHTSQLQEVIQTVGMQFKSLEIDNTGGVFVIINQSLDKELSVWGSGDTAAYQNKVHIPYLDRPIYTNLISLVKKGPGLSTETYSNEEKQEFFRHMFEIPPYNQTSKEHQQSWLAREGGYTRSVAVCRHTTLFMINHHGREFSDEENQILSRFAAVFEQSYTRFMDLQQAEKQAREAQIEAGLEKVRAASMAMHSSRQINNVVKVLYQQLKKLIEPFDIANIQVNQDDTRDLYFWNGIDVDMYDDMYQIPEADHTLFHEIYKAWNSENGAVSLKLNKTEKDAYFDIAFKYMPTSADRKKMIYAANGMTLVGFFNQNAAVNVIRYNSQSFSDENKHVVTRFSKVFEQTYTRFLDLQKAEAQARESQIEAALERVRAASMAMHRSEDLPKVALTFFNQIEHLQIPINAASINLVNESKESYRLYFANRHEVGITHELFIKDFWFAKESFRRLKEGEKEFTKACEGDNLKAWIEYIKRDISEERGLQLEKLGISKSYIHSVQFHELSHTIFSSISPLSDTTLKVLKRMTQAFGMSYIRFLDLQKAEAQAKEAQIEAALERVRSRTMAMHASDEFRETVGILFTQLNLLDFDIQQCSLTIIDEHKEEAESWQSASAQSLLPQSFKMQFPDDLYFRKNIKETLLKKEGYSVIEFEAEDKKQFDEYVFQNTPIKEAPKEVIDFMKSHKKIVLCRAYMRYGFIETVSNTSKLNPTKEAILQRFSKVLEQTYTRFLDLKNAEARAKEAQIETALERVRAQTMAMHSSDDVGKCIVKMFDEITALGVDEDTRFGIGILNHETQNNELWTVSKEGQEIKMHIGHIDMTWHPLLRSARKTWKAQKSLHQYVLEGEDLLNYYQMLNNAPHYPLHVEIENLPKKQFHYGFVFEHGFFYAFTLSELNSDLIHIIQRFTSVFAQTYRRYLDLVKAEAQAREAQIEAALERVRAKSLAMHRSEELADLSLELVKQVQALGIETWFCAFNIYDDDPKGSLEWGSNGIGTFPKYRTPREGIFLKYFEAGQSGETLLVNEIGEDECPAHYEYLCSLPGVGDQLLKMKREGIPFPTSQVDHVAYFQYGYLIFITYKPIPESFQIFKRFAKVFEQSYTRFLDLKKAEEQAREAQIEAALEKVRSSALAMHTSDDLLNVVTVLRQQMHELGEESLESTIIHLYHENADYLSAFWAFKRPGGSEDDIITGEVQAPTNNLWSKAVLENYHSEKNSYSILSEGYMLQEWYQVLEKIAPQTVDYDQQGNIIIPEKLFYYFSKFNGGALLVITEEEAVQNVIDLQQKAAKVFGLAYQRYSDLKLAEEQAILSKKEATLDRIRGQIASMRSVEDLQQITPLIWKELTILEIPFIRCGIFIMHPENEKIQMFFSTPSGESVRAIEIPFNTTQLVAETVQHWRDKSIYIIQWGREQFIEWTHDLINRGLIENEDSYYKDQPPPEHMVLHFIPFEQGMLYVGSLQELTENQKNLLQSISDVFSVAYARYEDFKVLENTLQELRSTQNQLIHSEKMASLGELTAGIAHEIQNPLNFVNNFSEIGVELIEEIEEELQNDDPVAAKEILGELIQNLQKIHHHGERASGIVRGMLDHSRAKSDEKSLTDINQLCDEYLRLAYHGLRAKNKSFQANFRLEADPELPKIMVASQDIGRVLLNLINNSFQATLEKSQKENNEYKPAVIVSTKEVNQHIEIKVMDNGTGIPDEVKDKIFQPFFTTKPAGQGTGLGLSLAYDIIKAHNGTIEIQTENGHGTTFLIRLPNHRQGK